MPSASADLVEEAPARSASAAPATRADRCRATASAAAVTALSSLTIEPWPARPLAVSRSQAMPFSRGLDQVEPQLVAEGEREAADLADRLGAALEEVGVVVDQPVRAVACRRPPRRRGRQHEVALGLAARRAAMSRTTARIIASMSFMSTAPRPQTQPSAISPANGSTCQSLGLRRHDVEVAVHEQRVAAAVLPSTRATSRPARVRTRRRRARARPRRAARRRTPRPPAPPARCRRRSWWSRSGSGRGRVDDLVLGVRRCSWRHPAASDGRRGDGPVDRRRRAL